MFLCKHLDAATFGIATFPCDTFWHRLEKISFSTHYASVRNFMNILPY